PHTPCAEAPHAERAGYCSSVGLEDSIHRTQAILDARQKQLNEQARALESEQAEWDDRRAEMEEERRTQSAAVEELQRKERELAAQRLDLEQREQILREAQTTAINSAHANQQEELSSVKRELGELRQQLHQGSQCRDRLVAHQAALRTAARKLQARKRQFEA